MMRIGGTVRGAVAWSILSVMSASVPFWPQQPQSGQPTQQGQPLAQYPGGRPYPGYSVNPSGAGLLTPGAAVPRPSSITTVPAVSAISPVTTPPAPAAMTPAQKPPRRAEVSFASGQLSITADNASLNQILREIGRLTGIAITGGVAEERVFGKYGPSPVPVLLDALLDGTGSNVLLIPGEDGGAGQLILTPRHGGVTPPNPNAPGFDDDAGGNPYDMQRIPASQRPPGVSLFGETPAGTVPVPPVPTNDQGNQINPTATNPQTPNGVKTPQEIFQQLQMLRQQQQQQQTPPQ